MEDTPETEAAHGAASGADAGAAGMPPAAADEAHAATATTEAHGGHEQVPFPPFNPEFFASQLFWLAICFGLFYLVLKRTVLPQIGGILEGRRSMIDGDIAAAERSKAESDAALAGYEQALAEARIKAHGIAEEARAESAAAIEAKRTETEAALSRRLAEAEASIAGIKRQALEQVGTIAADTTEALVQALIKADVSRAEIDGAVAAAMSR
jgi:F-type H+-transporting ATPase subunit b